MSELHDNRGIFERSGLASLSDLEAAEWRALFSFLEKEQRDFLSQEKKFRSPEYKWPLDALHTWSRVWEYPYVYHHLRAAHSRFQKSEPPVVVDFGSGVTFFPFAVAKLGYQVICSDIDPLCRRDLTNASRYLSSAPGSIEFRLLTETIPAFRDEEVDIIYCISVLEHIPDFESTVVELSRILKKGGLLLLTIDLDLRGGSELGVSAFKRLQDKLSVYFDPLWPEVTEHPLDMLCTNNGPYSAKNSKGITLAKRMLINHVIKPMLGRKPNLFFPNYLTVHGAALEKR